MVMKNVFLKIALLSFFLISVSATDVSATVSSYNRATDFFDAGQTKSFGSMANVPGTGYSAEEFALPYTDTGDTGMTDRATSLAIGCAALDPRSMMAGVLQPGLDDWSEFIDTDGFRDATNYIFSSPENVRIFAALEQYAYNRVTMATSKCAAFQVQDDQAKLVWEGVQQCVNQQMGGNFTPGAEDFSVNLGAAYMRCLNEPFSAGGGSSSDSLFASVRTALNSPKWSGTLYTALARTDFCSYKEGSIDFSKECYPLVFLPNIKWCARGEIQLTAEGNPYCVGESEERLYTPELISPQDVFDIAFAVSEDIVEYGYTLVDLVVSDSSGSVGMDTKTFRRAAQQVEVRAIGENANPTNIPSGPAVTPAGGVSPSTAFRYEHYGANRNQYNNFYGSTPPSGGGAMTVDWGNLTLVSPFMKYVGCSSAGRGPNFSGDIARIDQDMNIPSGNTLTEYLGFGSASGAMSGLGFLSPSGGFESDHFYNISARFDNPLVGDSVYQTSYSLGTDSVPFSGGGAADLNGNVALGMIGVAVACAAVHDLRLSLTDFIDIHSLGNSAQSAMLAYRTELAYMATLNVLNFIRYKLDIARMQVTYSPLFDPNGYPKHVVDSLDKLIFAFDARIDAMQEKRRIQKETATTLARGQALQEEKVINKARW